MVSQVLEPAKANSRPHGNRRDDCGDRSCGLVDPALPVARLPVLVPHYACGLDNWDIALPKETHFSESKVLGFCLETFNTFNHAQFFGANSVDGNINDSTFGQVINAMSPRLTQAALKFRF